MFKHVIRYHMEHENLIRDPKGLKGSLLKVLGPTGPCGYELNHGEAYPLNSSIPPDKDLLASTAVNIESPSGCMFRIWWMPRLRLMSWTCGMVRDPEGADILPLWNSAPNNISYMVVQPSSHSGTMSGHFEMSTSKAFGFEGRNDGRNDVSPAS